MSRPVGPSLFLTIFALSLATCPATAVLMPFVETFEDDPLGSSAPTLQGSSWLEMAGNWSVEPNIDGHVYRCDWGPYNYAYSFLMVPNAPGTNFTMSVDFGIQSFSLAGPLLPLSVNLTGLWGADGGFTVRYDIANGDTPSQQHRLVLTGPDDVAISLGEIAPVLQGPEQPPIYTMVVTGEYAVQGDPGSELTLVASLTDGTTLLTASTVATTASLGDQFGLYLVSNPGIAGAYATVDFDNFSIVPEPATLALLVMGGLAILRRRNR